ncbi:MAG: tetratricopeptide repeat protein [Thermoanaerobaculia bacterium]|nr:tetratricopeptide repeat protein [Thermoanaerobaculia bacterium]
MTDTPIPQPAHPPSFDPVAPSTTDQEWQVGEWMFRPLLHRLSQGERQVRLEPKVSDLLLFLVHRARQPVSKDAIFEGVWEQKFLGDSALTRTMAELRRALGDDARSPSYVETIPKIGYRLIADVQLLPSPLGEISDPPPEASMEEALGQVGQPSRWVRFGPWIVSGFLLVVLASLYAVPTFRPTIDASPKARTKPEVVTDDPKLVAVLPLVDLSQEPAAEGVSESEEFFAAGMTEALEARLAQAGTVGVISHHSVAQLLSEDDSVLERARGVGIDALVEGTIQRAGERVRITVRLTELHRTPDERHTYSWVETYERDLRNVLALQAEVSRAIADEVRKTLEPTIVAPPHTEELVDPEAYEVYLQARYQLNRIGSGPLEEAAVLFERAIEMSPGYAPAHSGRARAYARAAELGTAIGDVWDADLWEVALASTERALELDPESAEAHGVTATADILYRWDWQAAERHLRRALQTNPSDAWVRQRYAYFLTFLGRFDEAMEQVKESVKLDPLSPTSYRAASHVYFHAGHYDRVYSIFQLAVALLGEEGHDVRGYVSWSLAIEGRYEEAIERMAPSGDKDNHPWRPAPLAIYGWTLAQAGRTEEAKECRRLMLELPWEDPFARAILEVGLGDHDEAFAALERALDERSHSVPYLKVEPFLRSLQEDPRFDEMVARLGL